MNAIRTLRVAAGRSTVPTFPRLPPTTLHVRYKSDRGSTTLKNKYITQEMVHLVNEEGKLGPLTPYSSILAACDMKNYYLELVSTTPPIVKMLDRKIAHQRRKDAKIRERAVQKKNEKKEIQLTWQSGVGDVAHKVKKIREELEDGCKVDVVFTGKPKQPLPPLAEMTRIVDEVFAEVRELAKEWKPRERKRQAMIMFLQSVVPVEEIPLVVGRKPKGPKLEEPAVEDQLAAASTDVPPPS